MRHSSARPLPRPILHTARFIPEKNDTAHAMSQGEATSW
jgi:hypothetical protein